MLKNVQIRCEGGWIRLVWEWADPDTAGVRIYYKKKEAAQGDGSLFLQEEVLPLPHSQSGRAQREIRSEWGLYTFTLVPEMADGSIGEKMVIENIMLGEPLRVPWEMITKDGHLCISFLKFTGKIPAGIVCFGDGAAVYQMDYEISRDTLLLFPEDADAGGIHMYAKAPYDKAYDLCIRR